MLGRVVTEAACAEVYEVVDVLHVVVLEVGILSVHVGQSAHLAGGALHAVVVVGYVGESVGVEEVVVAAHGIVEAGEHGGVVDGGVVGEYVDDDLYTVSVCAVAHSLELVARAQGVVAYGPVGGLIIIVPFALHAVAGLAEEGAASTLAQVACEVCT